MFQEVNASDYWDTVDNSPPDAWFYGMGYILRDKNGWKYDLRPHYSVIDKKWLHVWKTLSREEALAQSRAYYTRFFAHEPTRKNWKVLGSNDYTTVALRESQPQIKPQMYIVGSVKVYPYRPIAQPIRLWEEREELRFALDVVVDRSDLYHPSAFSVWEKYPHLTNSVYQTVIHWLMTYQWKPKLLDYVLCYPIGLTYREKMLRAGIELPALIDEENENKAKTKLLFQGYEMQARDAMVKAASKASREINSFSDLGARGSEKESQLDYLHRVNKEVAKFSQFTGRNTDFLSSFAMLHALEQAQLLGDIISHER